MKISRFGVSVAYSSPHSFSQQYASSPSSRCCGCHWNAVPMFQVVCAASAARSRDDVVWHGSPAACNSISLYMRVSGSLWVWSSPRQQYSSMNFTCGSGYADPAVAIIAKVIPFQMDDNSPGWFLAILPRASYPRELSTLPLN